MSSPAKPFRSSVTVNDVCAVIPSYSARITLVPNPTARAETEESTATAEGLVEKNLTLSVRSPEAESDAVPVTRNCNFVPRPTDRLNGEIARPTSAGGVTEILDSAAVEPEVAQTVVSPTPVASPGSLINGHGVSVCGSPFGGRGQIANFSITVFADQMNYRFSPLTSGSLGMQNNRSETSRSKGSHPGCQIASTSKRPNARVRDFQKRGTCKCGVRLLSAIEL